MRPYPNSFYPLIDDDLRTRLQEVASSTRSSVRNGYITPSKIPSYKAAPMAPLDLDILKHQAEAQMARKAKSMNAIDFNTKQIRAELNDDEYGDTEDDEEDEKSRPVVDKNNKTYFRPMSHRSRSSQYEEFQEAEFLKKY